MVLGSFTGIRIGLSTVKAFCDALNKPCVSVSSLESLAYGAKVQNGDYIATLIDAKHENVYASIFEFNNEKYIKIKDFSFENIQDFLQNLSNLKKKIFFAGNCGILYKDVIKSYLKNDICIFEDTLPCSKDVGRAAFNKYKVGEILDSVNLNALYLKKSGAEESR